MGGSMGSVFGGPAGSGGQKFPSWTRAGNDYIVGGTGNPNAQPGDPGYFNSGFGRYAQGAEHQLPPELLYGGLPNVMNAANSGGSAIRGLAGQLSPEAIQAMQQYAGGAGGVAGNVGNLAGQEGNFLDASNQFAQGINHAQSQFQTAYGGADKILSDVMDPTAYNSLYQSSYNRALPDIRASMATRGVTSSGVGASAERDYGLRLNDQFAERQRQEQLAAAGLVGNLADRGGQLGVAASQVPGAVYSQFMQGNNSALQAYLQAQQASLGPLQAAGIGSDLFTKGVELPLGASTDIGNIAFEPGKTLGQLTTGSILQRPDQYHSFFGIGKI